MLSSFTGADKVYIACGYTDLRKGIDGLAMVVRREFDPDPFTNTLFLFCGRRRDRIKDSSGRATDLFLSISAWRKVYINGRGAKAKLNKLYLSNIVAPWKVSGLNNLKHIDPLKGSASFNALIAKQPINIESQPYL